MFLIYENECLGETRNVLYRSLIIEFHAEITMMSCKFCGTLIIIFKVIIFY